MLIPAPLQLATVKALSDKLLFHQKTNPVFYKVFGLTSFRSDALGAYI